MTNGLLKFDVPELINPYDRVDIICNLEALALSTFYISEDNQMGIAEMVELDFQSTFVELTPEKVYEESYDELIEIVGGYNFFIRENKLDKPLIRLAIDDAKTRLLKEGSEYPIYKVVLNNGLD